MGGFAQQMISMDAAINWFPQEIEAARPSERLSLSEWCPRKLVLTEKSDIKGPLSFDYTPYWKGLGDEILTIPTVQMLVLCASAQIAKSTFTYAVLLKSAEQEKRSSLIVLADEKTAKKVNKERLRRFFETSNDLSRIYDPKTVTMSDIPLLNGAGISMAWASSVAGLATFEFPLVICDEVDKDGYYTKSTEANAISLVIERMESFRDKLIILVSTPTVESRNIWSHLEGTENPDTGERSGGCDVVYDYHVPCPYCGQYQPLRWGPEHNYGFPDGIYRAKDGTMHKVGMVKWEGGRNATRKQIEAAGYGCGECGKLWTTIQKNDAVDCGEWVPRDTVEHSPIKVGAHIWRLYSKLGVSGDIPKLVRAWINAIKSKDPKEIQGFVNSTLAGPFKLKTQDRPESSIYALCDDRPRGTVPSENVLGLVGGADTQDNGFFYKILAVGQFLEPALVQDGFVESLEALDRILTGRFHTADGRENIVSFTLIDAMGHRTAEVYDFCRLRAHIKPSQGTSRMTSPYQVTKLDFYPGSNRPIPGGLMLYRVNVQYYKDQLYNKLMVPLGDPGGFRCHSQISQDYARQMVSEYRNEKGEWVCPEGRANHFWDCGVLALAAADIIGMQHWNPEPVVQHEPEPPTKPSYFKSPRDAAGGFFARR